ncbi:MAG: integration host factor subunit alpha [Burkholderiales bacterium]
MFLPPVEVSHYLSSMLGLRIFRCARGGRPATKGESNLARAPLSAYAPDHANNSTRHLLMALTRMTLADMLTEKIGLSGYESRDMVEAFFEEIRGALERRDAVKLSGFGVFGLRNKAQRPGRNPKTGEGVPVSARRVVVFRASRRLRAKIERKHRARSR